MIRSYGNPAGDAYTKLATEGVSLFRDVFSYSSDPRKVLAELEGKLGKALAEGNALEASSLQKQIAAQQAIIADMKESEMSLVVWNRIGQAAGIAAIVCLVSIPVLLFVSVAKKNPRRRRRSKR